MHSSANQDSAGTCNGARRPARVTALLLLALVAGVASAGMGLLYLHSPAALPGFAKCRFHRWTGLYCPGCGGTRAVYYLLHGKVLTAFHHNPLVMLAAPCMAVWLGWTAFRVAQGRRAPWPQTSERTVWAMLAVVAIYAVLRNLPWHPFTLLAP